MAIDPVTGQLIGAGASALVGMYGANRAASAQQESARQQADAARRSNLMGLQMNEPLRSSGYQALGDINSFFGYSTAPYTSANQLATSQTPLTAKQVLRAARGGATFDQIAQMGVLGQGGNDGKFIKRLVKAGLSMDQIQQLRTGMPQQQQAQAQPQGGAQGAPGQMNWDAITQAPDYQFQLQQGTKNLGNSFAARGGAASGNALRALSDFNQGLASQGLDKFISRRMGIINGGTQATNNVQNAGNNYTNALMDSQQQQGDARASGILGTAGAVMGGLNSLGQIYGNRQQNYSGFTDSRYGPYSGGYQLPPTVSGYGGGGSNLPRAQQQQYDWRNVLGGQ